jgi:hypothetical protein
MAGLDRGRTRLSTSSECCLVANGADGITTVGVAGPSVSPEEIKVLIDQGTEEGVFEPSEQKLVTNVLNLVADTEVPSRAANPLDRIEARDQNLSRPPSIRAACGGLPDAVPVGVRFAVGRVDQRVTRANARSACPPESVRAW